MQNLVEQHATRIKLLKKNHARVLALKEVPPHLRMKVIEIYAKKKLINR
jgi:hypothetical protein